MKPTLFLVFLVGCSETCPTPQASLDGWLWTTFIQPVTFTIENEPAFPAGSTPANGTHELEIEWLSGDLEGPVAVSIDGQRFEGEGRWDEQECGNFAVALSGIYSVEAGVRVPQSDHAFAATALLATYEQRLEGFLDWDESWQTPDAVGSYSVEAQLFGEGH